MMLGMTAIAAEGQSPIASPNSVIEDAMKLLETALTGHKDELAKDKEKLYQVIDQILLPRFDRDYAARLVLGPSWNSATADQRLQFTDSFYRNLLQKYADGVLEYDPTRVEVLPFRGDLTQPRVTVRTIVRLDDGTKTPVDYSLVKRDSGWLAFDVTIEGISYVRNYRAEINAEIQSSSLDAVIKRLQSMPGGASAQ
jgi:phospholipid transport system substrate-binding protein